MEDFRRNPWSIPEKSGSRISGEIDRGVLQNSLEVFRRNPQMISRKILRGFPQRFFDDFHKNFWRISIKKTWRVSLEIIEGFLDNFPQKSSEIFRRKLQRILKEIIRGFRQIFFEDKHPQRIYITLIHLEDFGVIERVIQDTW